MTEVPWWATGAFTLGGVAVTWAANVAMARSRVKYEDKRRWHQERKALYLKISKEIMGIERALYERFEQGLPLPNDLKERVQELGESVVEVELIGSSSVTNETKSIVECASMGVQHALNNEAGATLDQCDNMRHIGYYLKDLIRADLTNDRKAVRLWRAGRVRRWFMRRRARRELA